MPRVLVLFLNMFFVVFVVFLFRFWPVCFVFVFCVLCLDYVWFVGMLQ